MLKKAVRPPDDEGAAQLEGFFAEGCVSGPAVFLAAMNIATSDDIRLFPIPLPPMPPRPSAKSRRPKQRWGRAYALWSTVRELITMLNNSEKPGGILEKEVALEEEQIRASQTAIDANHRIRHSSVDDRLKAVWAELFSHGKVLRPARRESLKTPTGDGLWQQLTKCLTESYGKPVSDIPGGKC